VQILSVLRFVSSSSELLRFSLAQKIDFLRKKLKKSIFCVIKLLAVKWRKFLSKWISCRKAAGKLNNSQGLSTSKWVWGWGSHDLIE